MSQRQVKAARRHERERLVEHIVQAHDRLHKDDVDGCHQLLHGALGIGEHEGEPIVPLRHLQRFDEAFRRLCIAHGRKAYYVVIDTVDDDGRARLVSGGDADLSNAFDRALRGLAADG